jgi:hypothetical protein
LLQLLVAFQLSDGSKLEFFGIAQAAAPTTGMQQMQNVSPFFKTLPGQLLALGGLELFEVFPKLPFNCCRYVDDGFALVVGFAFGLAKSATTTVAGLVGCKSIVAAIGSRSWVAIHRFGMGLIVV